MHVPSAPWTRQLMESILYLLSAILFFVLFFLIGHAMLKCKQIIMNTDSKF